MDSPKGHGDCIWWTQDRIAQLKRRLVQAKSAYGESIALTLLDMIAENAGNWLELKKLCDKAHIKNELQGRGGLASITNIMKDEFSLEYEKTWWPVEIEFRPARYCMPVEIARRWKEA